MAMRRALTFALCSLLLAGCTTRGFKSTAPGGDDTGGPSHSLRTVPSPVQVVGRIIAVDLLSLVVVIELAPYSTVPANIGGRSLIARHDDLRPTARLEASSYLRGRTVGARLLTGQPQVGNEVVLVPEAP